MLGGAGEVASSPHPQAVTAHTSTPITAGIPATNPASTDQSVVRLQLVTVESEQEQLDVLRRLDIEVYSVLTQY